MWARLSGSHAYVDTNILILAVEIGHRWGEVLRALFAAIDDRSIRATTSELTLAEVLAKPLAEGATGLVKTYEHILSPESVIHTAPIDRLILRSAAGLQGQLGIKLHDAIHVATARSSGCRHFITNDSRLGRKLRSGLVWLSLSDTDGSVSRD